MRDQYNYILMYQIHLTFFIYIRIKYYVFIVFSVLKKLVIFYAIIGKGGNIMIINIERNLVEFTPERPDEKAKLMELWKLIVDCVRFNKKLVPVGEYIPEKNNLARFAIEGQEASEFAEIYVETDCRAYCQTCNKYVILKKGDRIPPCCGKLMEIID